MFKSFVTPRTAAGQAPLSIGFPREEYWSGLPFPYAGDLPGPGIKPTSPALAGRSFPTEPPGKPISKYLFKKKKTKLEALTILNYHSMIIKSHVWTDNHKSQNGVFPSIMNSFGVWYMYVKVKVKSLSHVNSLRPHGL